MDPEPRLSPEELADAMWQRLMLAEAVIKPLLVDLLRQAQGLERAAEPDGLSASELSRVQRWVNSFTARHARRAKQPTEGSRDSSARGPKKENARAASTAGRRCSRRDPEQ